MKARRMSSVAQKYKPNLEIKDKSQLGQVNLRGSVREQASCCWIRDKLKGI